MPTNKDRTIYSTKTTVLIVDAQQTRAVSVNTKLLTLFKPLLALMLLLLLGSIAAIIYLASLSSYRAYQVKQANQAKLQTEQAMHRMAEEVDALKNMTSEAVQQKLIGLRQSEQVAQQLQQYLRSRGVEPPVLTPNDSKPNDAMPEDQQPSKPIDELHPDTIPNNIPNQSTNQHPRPLNLADSTVSRLSATDTSSAMGGPEIKALLDVPYIGNYPKQMSELLTMLRQVPMGRPHSGEISSRFGARSNPFGKRTREFHHGLDFRGTTGETIRATADGTVMIAGRQNGYGLVVKIKHGYGYSTVYAHLSAIDVEVGQQVKASQPIGKLGSTGRSTGPHLHYEVRHHNETLNPEQYLAIDAPSPKRVRTKQ